MSVDPELRSYLGAFLVLLSALVVTTMGLLVVATGRVLLPVVVVGILTVFVAGAVHEYVATVTSEDEERGSKDPSRQPRS